MPFTLSHAIAVFPIKRLLGKHVALSALIIGSMTPDFAKITPQFDGILIPSDNLLGIYFFCVPVGLTVYFLYHLFMAPVIVSLLPKKLQQHLSNDLFLGRVPDIRGYVLILSIILGAATHNAWDFLTHNYGLAQHVNWMNIPLANIVGQDIMPYQSLQHLSSLIGLGVLIFFSWRWYQQKNHSSTTLSTTEKSNSWRATQKLKIFAILLISIISISAGLKGIVVSYIDTDVASLTSQLHTIIRSGIIWAAGGFISSTVIVGAIYQVTIFQVQSRY